MIMRIMRICVIEAGGCGRGGLLMDRWDRFVDFKGWGVEGRDMIAPGK